MLASVPSSKRPEPVRRLNFIRVFVVANPVLVEPILAALSYQQLRFPSVSLLALAALPGSSKCPRHVPDMSLPEPRVSVSGVRTPSELRLFTPNEPQFSTSARACVPCTRLGGVCCWLSEADQLRLFWAPSPGWDSPVHSTFTCMSHTFGSCGSDVQHHSCRCDAQTGLNRARTSPEPDRPVRQNPDET